MAERDPLLLRHLTANGVYSIAGKYNPASVKDQMVRAVAIIDRAVRYELIKSGKKLLVVGAGAAGVSAAIRGAENLIQTTLVERHGTPFTRQGDSRRVVDPTEYDWPYEHWAAGVLEGFPLTIKRAPAQELAILWMEEYSKSRKFLRTIFHTKFVDAHREPGTNGRMVALLQNLKDRDLGLLAKCGDDSGGLWGRFDMILDCTGPGTESVQLPGCEFRCFPFWQNDQLEIDGFGLPPAAVGAGPKFPKILISGGGDGALQDFLRIAFPKLTPKDIYGRIPKSFRVEIERRIYCAEDAFRRAWVWTQDQRLECEVLRTLHQAHLATARWLKSEWPQGQKLLKFTDRVRNVRVAHRCDHFSPCYPFNRFLALLVNEYLRAGSGGAGHFLSGHHIHSIRPSPRLEKEHPQCNGHAEECWQYPHEVNLAVSQECGHETVPIPDWEEYDLVILRHGPVAGTPKLARQHLPYGLPWKP